MSAKEQKSELVTPETAFDKQFENVNELFAAMNYNPLMNMATASNMIGAYLRIFCQINPFLRQLFNELDSGGITEEAAQRKFEVKIDEVTKIMALQHRIDSTAVKYYKPSKKPIETRQESLAVEDLVPMMAVSFKDQYDRQKTLTASNKELNENLRSAGEVDKDAIRFQARAAK